MELAAGWQRHLQAPATGHTQFGEHLAQMPFDGTGADEQLCRDLRVGASIAGEPGNVVLLSSQVVDRVDLPPPDLLAGREQLPPSPVRESLRAEMSERFVCGVQLVTGI